jgi:membrane protease YdiL (CAAX protease family)
MPDADPIQKDIARVGWGPVAAIVVSVVAYFVGFFTAGLITYAIAALQGKHGAATDAWLATTTGQFIFVCLAEGLVIAIIALFLRQRRNGLQALGFHRRPAVRDVALALLGFVTYFIVLIAATALASKLLHIDVNQKQELGFDAVNSTPDKLMAFASLVLLPPFVEEVLFRGFLFTGLRRRASFITTTIFVSLVFASLHLLEGGDQGVLWIAGIDTFILSLVLCYLREKTGNLWASILVHALKNSLAFIFLYLVGTNL